MPPKQYIDKLLSLFRFHNAKPRSTYLENHLIFSKKQSPKTTKEPWSQEKGTYASAIMRMMYVMVYIRLGVPHVMEVISLYMSNLENDH